MYRGRFAPSPTGPLHLGSLAAAMGSYLDAKQHAGQWLIRIEDVDTTRAQLGMADEHLRTLEALGFEWNETVLRQSQRGKVYQDSLEQLALSTYQCRCTRSDLARQALAAGQTTERGKETVYLGHCRDAVLPNSTLDFATRLALPNQTDTNDYKKLTELSEFQDRWLGNQFFDPRAECGDFVLQRADNIFSYQLAVVVDDNEQAITHIVRGQDLLNNTPRQRWLQYKLSGYCKWQYAHLPLVLGDDGQKLSKQNGAQALDLKNPLQTLNFALLALGLPASQAGSVPEFWRNQLSAQSLKGFGQVFRPDQDFLFTDQTNT
jgi:glutamyl-Q tRNA(Asp) synthetase